MGQRGHWFAAVRRVFSPEPRDKKAHHRQHSRRGWGFGACTNPSYAESYGDASPPSPLPQPPPPPPPPPPPAKLLGPVDAKLAEERSERDSVIEAEADAVVVILPASTRFQGMPRDEAAAMRIQIAFRGYLARRALRALRGLGRLKSLVHGNAIKRQTANTLQCMQTLARVQSQIRSRRVRMTEENQALQRQLLLKRERELEKLRIGEGWDDSLQSKEQIEANLLNKQEAAIRRERALAYAFSHQWKSSSRSANPLFMDPNNPQWGWSWLERWMATKPWESNTERTKLSRPSSRQSPSTPPSRASSVAAKAKLASPRGEWAPLSDESRSMLSLPVERHRRHSIGGLSIRDDESLASSTSARSYVGSTRSAKVKSRYLNPTSEVDSAKKRLSFTALEKPAPPSPPARVRRHSVPPKVNIASLKEVSV